MFFYSSKMIEDHSYKLSKLVNMNEVIQSNNKNDITQISNSLFLIKLSKWSCRLYLFLELSYYLYTATRYKYGLNKLGMNALMLYLRLNLVWYMVLSGTNYIVKENTKIVYDKYLYKRKLNKDDEESLDFKKFIKHSQLIIED